jgi:hypothetical protein
MTSKSIVSSRLHTRLDVGVSKETSAKRLVEGWKSGEMQRQHASSQSLARFAWLCESLGQFLFKVLSKFCSEFQRYPRNMHRNLQAKCLRSGEYSRVILLGKIGPRMWGCQSNKLNASLDSDATDDCHTSDNTRLGTKPSRPSR